MHNAVDYRRGHLVAPEYRPPAAELKVRRDDHRLALVGVGEDLEHQPRPVRVERQEAELVDDEQPGAGYLGRLPVEPPLVPGAPEPHDERGGLEEPASIRRSRASWHSALAMRVLPVPTSPMSTRSSHRSRNDRDSRPSLPSPSGQDTDDQS